MRQAAVTAKLVALAVLVLVSLTPLSAASKPHDPRADYDIRDDHPRNDRPKEKSEKIRDAAERLKREVPGLAIDFSEHTGVPEIVTVARGRQKLTAKSREPREHIARGFLQRNADLFGLTPNEVAQLKKTADYANPSGNLTWVEFAQEIDGLPVFRGRIRFAITTEGEIVHSTGNLVPAIEDAPRNRKPDISAAAAVIIAAESIGVSITPSLKEESGTSFTFDRGPFNHDITAALEYFPLDGGVVTLAWSMILWQDDAVFYTYVSAEDGEVLWRKNLVHYQSQPATYVVYGSDSPSPLSPTTVTAPGSGFQPPLVPRTTFTVISEHAFNNLGWMTDGTSITTGNNVDVGLDLTAPDGIDAGTRATGTAFRVFDYPYSPPPGNPPPGDAASLLDFRFGEVVNLFFWANRYHDRLYELGFTEAAGNFQHDNFGRGGLGNDRLIVEAQDFALVNNARFAALPDGISGRIEMFLFTGPDPDRSGGLDQEVFLHELTHGVSTRLHANTQGIGNTNMGGGMGEGWSDFFARALLSTPDEDINGIYPSGAYLVLNRFPGFADNYYYGVRRFPYALMSTTGPNGRPHNPLTFADIDPTQADLTDGAYPRGPGGQPNPFEAHTMGEVWCSTLLEVRARLINRLGYATGNQLAMQLAIDGMKLDPANPTFLQGRNAILAANFGSVNASAATELDIWRGFAIRGMGFSARAIAHNNSSVVEAFDIPNVTTGNVTILSDGCDGNGLADPGETVTLSIPFTNPYLLNDINDAVVTVGGTTTALGPLAPGQTVTRTFNIVIPPSATCGVLYDLPVTIASAFGTVTRTHALPTGTPVNQENAGIFTSGNVAVPIPDNGTVEVPIHVTSSGPVGTVNAFVRLNHPFVGELVMTLIAPDGSSVQLSNRRGGAGDNFGTGANDCSGTATGFGDGGSASIAAGVAPFNGTFRPESPMVFAFRNHEMNGTWKLRVSDIDPGDLGVIGCVRLELSRMVSFCCGVQGTPNVIALPPPALAGECSLSANGAPDPGEIVTMNFPLRNIGSGVTTNLVATLLDGGGVTSLGEPQTYGVLSPIGQPVARPFELMISSSIACGSDAIATFALSDDGVDLGTVSFNIRTGAPVVTVTSFSNTTPIQIPAAGLGAPSGAPANPYPSSIAVSGLAGTVSGVSLTIRNFTHGSPGDIDLLLVGPAGQKFIAMSDVGGVVDANNLTITLDDAGAFFPPFLSSATYRPSNSGTQDTFPAPAPPAPYQSAIPLGQAGFTSVFSNSNPNGTWSLYIVDDTGIDAGSIAGGWTLTLRTTSRVCAPVSAPVISGASATPSTLWPPDHQMHDVDVAYSVDSDCAVCSLSVTSSEPDDGSGDGNTDSDFEVVDGHRVRLRAERSGTVDARIYSIAITCANGAGTAVQTVPVRVEHDGR
jgi:subtilisin-like proprotein convertase family protein